MDKTVLYFYRAALFGALGSAIMLSRPSGAALLLYVECRNRALYNIACGLEELAGAMSFNPS